MYFLASKMLWLLFAPSSFLILCLGAAVIFGIFRRIRAALILGGASAVMLAVVGFSPLAEHVAPTLEDRFPAYQEDGRPIDGVIVLGGAVNVASSVTHNQLVLGGAADRLVAMADLARRYPAAKVIFTGGSNNLGGSHDSEARLVSRALDRFGLPANRILFETESRNTYENALMTKALLTPDASEHWVLVTSALHMPRAMGLFRAAGFHLEAYPVDWRTARDYRGFGADETAASRLTLFDAAIREWIGLAAAYLIGQSDEFFPAP